MSQTWQPEPSPPGDERLIALTNGVRSATRVRRPQPLGVEVRVDIDGDHQMTQVHRQKAKAGLHAAALDGHFHERDWA